jgi:hypothetical protein
MSGVLVEREKRVLCRIPEATPLSALAMVFSLWMPGATRPLPRAACGGGARRHGQGER